MFKEKLIVQIYRFQCIFSDSPAQIWLGHFQNCYVGAQAQPKKMQMQSCPKPIFLGVIVPPFFVKPSRSEMFVSVGHREAKEKVFPQWKVRLHTLLGRDFRH